MVEKVSLLLSQSRIVLMRDGRKQGNDDGKNLIVKVGEVELAVTRSTT